MIVVAGILPMAMLRGMLKARSENYEDANSVERAKRMIGLGMLKGLGMK